MPYLRVDSARTLFRLRKQVQQLCPVSKTARLAVTQRFAQPAENPESNPSVEKSAIMFPALPGM